MAGIMFTVDGTEGLVLKPEELQTYDCNSYLKTMPSQRDDCRCKVGRTDKKYELSNIDSRLADDWQSGTSIRRLTEELNKNIIKSELSATNVSQVEWSQTPVYEAIYTDELNDAEEIEIRRELERAGIDIEQLSSDLVSHQTVYRHLTQCLDTSKGDNQTPDERRDKAKDTVYALQQRTEIVTETTIDQLQSAGVTNLGDVEVLVDLQVVCNDCGLSMDFESAISEGCNCNST